MTNFFEGWKYVGSIFVTTQFYYYKRTGLLLSLSFPPPPSRCFFFFKSLVAVVSISVPMTYLLEIRHK